MDAYIVIGRESTGKSSLVRALSGVGTIGERIMETVSGNTFRLWARHSSLQEAQVTPDEFIGAVNLKNVDAVLLTVWPRASTRTNIQNGEPESITYPDSSGYIQAFVRTGWNIRDIVTLNNPDLPPLPCGLENTIRIKDFNNSEEEPFNVFTASVRTYWEWK